MCTKVLKIGRLILRMRNNKYNKSTKKSPIYKNIHVAFQTETSFHDFTTKNTLDMVNFQQLCQWFHYSNGIGLFMESLSSYRIHNPR